MKRNIRIQKLALRLRGKHCGFLNSCLHLLCILAFVLAGIQAVRAQAIVDAVKKGDTAKVRELLAANTRAAISATDQEGYSALERSAMPGGRSDIMLLLLAGRGADVNAQNPKNGWTPIHEASWYGRTDDIDLLTRFGARLDLMTNDGNMPIHKAAHGGQSRSITYLLMHGADVDSRNRDGNTPLAVAASHGQGEACKTAYSCRAQISTARIIPAVPLSMKLFMPARPRSQR